MQEFLGGFFVNPQFWLIAGAVVSVPIIIHLINRLRYKRIRWAAMEFLLKAQKKNRRKLIIEQLLLLALRCLLIGLVGILVMRLTAVNFADIGVKQSIHIVLLDDSLSMQDRWKKGDGYTNCFEVARDEMLIGKLGEHLSRSKTADQIMVLPLSQAVGEVVFAQNDELTANNAPDSTFGESGGRMTVVPIGRPLEKGVRYTVQAVCEGFKGHVRLIAPNEKVLIGDDHTEGTANPAVDYVATESGEYKVVVASHDGKVGKFQLEVNSGGVPKVYVPSTEFKKFKEETEKLEPTKLHLSLLSGLRRARKLADQNSGAMITLHILSDFRKKDWGDEAAALHRELLEFSKQHKAEVRLIDTMLDPARSATQGSPPGHDNVGIVDLRPRARMVGKNMPATFTLSIANYSGQDVTLNAVAVYETRTGRRCVEVDSSFSPSMPLKLASRRITQASFELRFNPEIGDDESSFEGISAHLEGISDKDGLPFDDVGYGVVEVRKQVPVLIIDGEGKDGYKDGFTSEAKGKDSFFLKTNLISVPGANFDESGNESLRPFRVDFPYEMKDKDGKPIPAYIANPAAVLEKEDLRKYPAIILCNVPKLTAVQLANLKKYVNNGGGLSIFLGPLVDTDFYNKEFFEAGKGIFPVKLKKTYYPPEGTEPLDPVYIPGVPMMIVRDEDPKLRPFPIFGGIITAPKHREQLEYVPVKRYFQIEKRSWRDEKADDKGWPRVLELITLGNDKSLEEYQKQVMDIIGDPDAGKSGTLPKLLEREEFARYRGTTPDKGSRGSGFERYRVAIKKLMNFSGQKPFFLARELEGLLTDKGETKDSPNMEDFWSNPDPDVQRLKAELKKLLEKVRYDDGAPYMLASSYGHGKVVTVMGTAGTLWNKWAGGIEATYLYIPFIWETQNYLSAQGADVNMTLGQRLDVNVNTSAFELNKSVEMIRTLQKEIKEKPFVPVPDDGQIVIASAEKPLEPKLTFRYPMTKEPGVYLTQLFDLEARKAAPVEGKEKGKEKDKDGKKPAEQGQGNEKGQGNQQQGQGDEKKGQGNEKKEPMAKDLEKVKDLAKVKKLKPLWTAASVFNIDTINEGNLERIAYETMKINVLDKSDKRILFTGTDVTPTEMVPTRKDLSEMPLLFLLFLAILVAEQALSVHLSFHLKGNESAGAPPGQARRSAA